MYGERGSIYQHAEIGEYAGPYFYASADPQISSFADMYEGFKPVAPELQAVPSGIDPVVQPFALQLLHFRDAVLAKQKPAQNTLDINHNTIAILDGVAESLKTDHTVQIKPL